MRFAICNELFEGWDWQRVCRYCAELGYEGLEVAPFTLSARITDLTPSRRAELRREAANAGLELIGLHWLLAKTQGLHLTSPDPAIRRATSDYLIELGRACRDLGGSILVFGSPKQRDVPPGVSPDQGFAYAAETFRACLPALADFGVTLCLEPLAPSETNFLTSCAEAARLLDEVNAANFRLHLDVKAIASEAAPPPSTRSPQGPAGERIAEVIRKYGPRAAHFHANDANLKGPGFGAIDFVPIFQALRELDYKGWVSVEVFDYRPGAETLAAKSIEYMRHCLQKSRETRGKPRE